MKRSILLSAVAAATVGSLISGGVAFGGPYAATITEASGQVTFRLGETADDVIVIRDGVPESLGSLNRGSASFSRNGASNYVIRSIRTNGLGYQDAIGQRLVTNSTNAGFIGLDSTALALSDDSVFLNFERPVGTAVNKNPATPELFGRIYVANPRSQTTAAGRTMGDGVYIVNPDFTDALGQGNTALTGGIAFVLGIATGTTSPWDVNLDADGNVYLSDWSDTNGTVFRTDPNVSDGSGVNMFTGLGGTGSFQPSATQNHGSISAFAVTGSLASGTLKIFTLDEDLSADGTSAGVQGLWSYNIGATTSGFNGIPTPGANPFLKIQGVQQDLDVGSRDGKIYGVQTRANGGESGLFVFSPDGSKLLYSSLADSIRLNQDGFLDDTSTSTLTTVTGGVQDALRGTRAMAVSPDQRWLAAATDLSGGVWMVPLIDGVPDIANRLFCDGFVGVTSDSVEFDAAGNLYVGNRSNEFVRIFSPGGISVTEYSSAGTFSYRNEPDFNGSGNFSDGSKWLLGVVPNAADAYATVGNFSSGNQALAVDSPIQLSRLRLAGGNYTVSGSTITMGAGLTEPRIIAEAGNHVVSAPLDIQKNVGYGAHAGASLTVTSPTYANAQIELTKWGAGTVTHPVINQDRVIIRSGTLKIAAGSATSVVKSLEILNQSQYNYAEGTGSLTIVSTPQGALDINNNAFVLDYTGNSQFAAVKAQILSGRNGGAWNGLGITSSAAAANPLRTGIGYAEASQIGNTFAGVSVDADAVVFRYTLLGDANLTGTVNLDDFTALAAAFGSTSAEWINGDFNYDGTVNLDDFTALAANFGAPLPADAARSAVPEPAALGTLALAAGAMLRRRRA